MGTHFWLDSSKHLKGHLTVLDQGLFLDTFRIQRILSFLLFLDTFHVQGIWSFLEMKRGKETPLKFTLSTIHIDRSSLVYSKGGHIARLPHLTLGRFASEIADDFESFE